MEQICKLCGENTSFGYEIGSNFYCSAHCLVKEIKELKEAIVALERLYNKQIKNTKEFINNIKVDLGYAERYIKDNGKYKMGKITGEKLKHEGLSGLLREHSILEQDNYYMGVKFQEMRDYIHYLKAQMRVMEEERNSYSKLLSKVEERNMHSIILVVTEEEFNKIKEKIDKGEWNKNSEWSMEVKV